VSDEDKEGAIPVLPPSYLIREGMRELRSLVALVIVGLLLKDHSVSPEVGITAILAILAGNLYPRGGNQVP
jgi:hypothetical protein